MYKGRSWGEFWSQMKEFRLSDVSNETAIGDFKPWNDMSNFPLYKGTVVVGELEAGTWTLVKKPLPWRTQVRIPFCIKAV